MTRKSKRELEHTVDDLAPKTGDEPDVWTAYRTSSGWVDENGDPVPEDATVAVAFGGVSMKRSKAEAQGYEIIDTVESETNPEADIVTVPWDYGDKEGPGE